MYSTGNYSHYLVMTFNGVQSVKTLHHYAIHLKWRQPGTRAPLLQCLYLDKCLLPQHNTKKLLGTKSNCEHVQLGHIMNNKTQKDQNPSCHL